MQTKVGKTFVLTDISRTASLVIGGSGDNIAEGEGVVLDKNKNIMTAGQTYSDTDTIYIVEGLGDTYDYVNEAGTAVTGVRKLLYSDPIDGSAITEWSGQSYAAATEAVWSVDLTGWVPVVGTEYAIKIVYKDLETTPRQFSRTYYYVATSTTLDTEGAAIAALINADATRRVDATYTAGTDVLALTGKALDDNATVDSVNEYKQVNFEVFLVSDNFDTYTSSALTTEPHPGYGTWQLVRDEEKWSMGYEGVSNLTQFPVVKPSFRTVLNETYDTLIIRHKNRYKSAGNREEQVDIATKIFVPNPAASNQSTDILSVLNPWIASTPSALPNVSV